MDEADDRVDLTAARARARAKLDSDDVDRALSEATVSAALTEQETHVANAVLDFLAAIRSHVTPRDVLLQVDTVLSQERGRFGRTHTGTKTVQHTQPGHLVWQRTRPKDGEDRTQQQLFVLEDARVVVGRREPHGPSVRTVEHCEEIRPGYWMMYSSKPGVLPFTYIPRGINDGELGLNSVPSLPRDRSDSGDLAEKWIELIQGTTTWFVERLSDFIERPDLRPKPSRLDTELGGLTSR